MSPGPRRTLRLLPWTGPEAKPCFLITDDGGGRVSRLADVTEAMQLDIHELAEATKLKADHLRALEQGQYDVFTAPVYLRGSLRTTWRVRCWT